MVLPLLEQTCDSAEGTPLVMGLADSVTSPMLEYILLALSEGLPGLTMDLRRGSTDQLIDISLKGGMDRLLIAVPDPLPERL